MTSTMARLLTSSGLVIAAGSAVPAHAGAWDYAGQSQISASYEDNVRLSLLNPVESANGTAQLSGQMQYQDDDFFMRVTPRVQAVRYDAERAFNRTEQYLSVLARNSNETGATSLLLSGAQDTTLTSELGLTGFAEANKKHRTWAATFNRNGFVSERFEAGAQLYASAHYYLDAERTGLVDYRYGSVALNASYNVTERSKFSLQGSVGQLQVPDISGYDKTNMAVSLGYGVQLTPRWRANVAYGPSRIRNRGGVQNGVVYDASLTRQSERSALSLAASRDVTPTGRGLLSRREQFRVALNQTMSERWSTEWSAALIRNRELSPVSTVEQYAVTYGDLTARLSWRITPTWSLSVTAGYSQQQQKTISEETAQRRHAGLTVSWSGLARRWD